MGPFFKGTREQPMSLKRICGWCGVELGVVECQQTGTTTGICKACQSKEITDDVLLPEHRQAGLSLSLDDHIVQLMRGKQQIAIFTSHATKDAIRGEADKHLSI